MGSSTKKLFFLLQIQSSVVLALFIDLFHIGPDPDPAPENDTDPDPDLTLGNEQDSRLV